MSALNIDSRMIGKEKHYNEEMFQTNLITVCASYEFSLETLDKLENWTKSHQFLRNAKFRLHNGTDTRSSSC